MRGEGGCALSLRYQVPRSPGNVVSALIRAVGERPALTLIQKHTTKTGQESNKLYHSPTDLVLASASFDRVAAEKMNGVKESRSKDSRLMTLHFSDQSHTLVACETLTSI